ncbi:unnamed protein product, partial [Closterium sp. Naga37s-1]
MRSPPHSSPSFPIPPHLFAPISHPHQEDGFRPGLVGGLLAQERVLAIVAGRYFTLAITQHGRLFTWGANLYTGNAPWRHEHDSGFDDDTDAAADESWLGVAPGVPLDRPSAVRVPPHLGSHPGGGEEGRAAGPEVRSVKAAHHTTFAVTADYKAVSWGEAGPLLGRAWGEGQGQVPVNRLGVVGSGGGGGGAVGGEGVVGLDPQTVEKVSVGEGFAVARLSHGMVYSWGDNQHGQLGRPAPPQDGTPALVQGLEHLEVLLVVAGSQQGLVLCRALQGSEAALEPQEFDNTRVLNEEHVSPATLHDPDATAPAASVPVPGAARAVVGAGGAAGVGGGASAEEQGGTGGEGAVARDMWMKLGEEFKMLPRQGMDSSMRNPCWRVQAGSVGSAGSGGNEGAAGPEVHCLPHFFIIGATRAGTQDLYRKLTSSIMPALSFASSPPPCRTCLSRPPFQGGHAGPVPQADLLHHPGHIPSRHPQPLVLNRSPLYRPPFSASLPLVLSPPATQQPPSSSPHSHSPPSPPLILLNFNPLKNP